MNAYRTLLTDLADAEPNVGYNAGNLTLTSTQTAIVIDQYPDVVAEAIAGHENSVSDLMSGEPNVVKATLFASLYASWLRAKAARYILSDLQTFCDDRAEAKRIDNEFAREPA